MTRRSLSARNRVLCISSLVSKAIRLLVCRIGECRGSLPSASGSSACLPVQILGLVVLMFPDFPGFAQSVRLTQEFRCERAHGRSHACNVIAPSRGVRWCSGMQVEQLSFLYGSMLSLDQNGATCTLCPNGLSWMVFGGYECVLRCRVALPSIFWGRLKCSGIFRSR